MEKRTLLIAITTLALFWMSFSFGKNIYLNHISFEWQSFDAQVTQVNYPDKAIALLYEYNIEGQIYLGSRTSFLSAGTLEDKYLLKDILEVGSNIKVYVDPTNFSRSVVLRKEFKIDQYLVSVAFIFFCLIALYCFIFRRKQFYL